MESLIGKELTCFVTGKSFIGAREGITVNYARDSKGNIYSDEGVDIAEKRELLDRSKPFSCYLSSDGKHITGWKGNVLGKVTYMTEGKRQTYIRAKDVHGGYWTGRGEGRGMCITIRPSKS